MYTGFFLNLAANTVRRDAMVNRLKAVGAESLYQRVDAVEGRKIAQEYLTQLSAGALGLWMTHVGVVRAQVNSPVHLHILEDDTMLADNALELFGGMLKNADATLGDWDIIFTEVGLPPHTELFSKMAQRMTRFRKDGIVTLLPLNKLPFSGTGSVFLRRQSLGKYLSVMDRGWTEGLPIDLFLRKVTAFGKLKAYVTLPFLTCPSPLGEQSDIQGSLSASQRMFDLYRRAFFKDADLEDLHKRLQELQMGSRISALNAIFLTATAFMFSDKWEGF